MVAARSCRAAADLAQHLVLLARRRRVGQVRQRRRARRSGAPRPRRPRPACALTFAATSRISAIASPRRPRPSAWPRAIFSLARFCVARALLERGQQLAAARVERDHLVDQRRVDPLALEPGTDRVRVLADQLQVEHGGGSRGPTRWRSAAVLLGDVGAEPPPAYLARKSATSSASCADHDVRGHDRAREAAVADREEDVVLLSLRTLKFGPLVRSPPAASPVGFDPRAPAARRACGNRCSAPGTAAAPCSTLRSARPAGRARCSRLPQADAPSGERGGHGRACDVPGRHAAAHIIRRSMRTLLTALLIASLALAGRRLRRRRRGRRPRPAEDLPEGPAGRGRWATEYKFEPGNVDRRGRRRPDHDRVRRTAAALAHNLRLEKDGDDVGGITDLPGRRDRSRQRRPAARRVRDDLHRGRPRRPRDEGQARPSGERCRLTVSPVEAVGLAPTPERLDRPDVDARPGADCTGGQLQHMTAVRIGGDQRRRRGHIQINAPAARPAAA